MNKYAYLGLGLAFLGGVALGGGIGYKFAVSKLDDKYNEQMEAEIARTRAFYDRVNKTGDFETPESAAAALGLVDEAADALLSYQGHPAGYSFPEADAEDAAYDAAQEASEGVEDLVAEIEQHNVFETAVENRSADHPYQISMLEFAENETDYAQLSITYYAGDKVLTDDQDKPVESDRVIGLDNLERFGEDRVIYIRNERLQADYEVSKSDGKYAHQVLGFNHSDETFQSFHRRTRSADE